MRISTVKHLDGCWGGGGGLVCVSESESQSYHMAVVAH